MIVLAVDPGTTGALAFYKPNYQPQHLVVHDMPVVDGDVNASALWHMIKYIDPQVAIIEHVHSHPKEGV